MRVAIFFLWLCFFLVKGGEYSQAVEPSHNSGCAHVQHTYPGQPEKSFVTIDAGTVITNINLDHQNQYFIIAGDVEDENTNDSFARKFKWLDKCYSTQFYQSAIGYSINRSKFAPLFYGRISYKYILQGALRV